MEDLSNGQTHEQQSTSSASSTMELEREDTVCINPGTHDNNEDAEPPTTALEDRDNYGVLGSSRSMEDVQTSGNSMVTTQRPRPSPAPSGQATQGNAATTPQQSADSVPHGGVSSSSVPTTANANTITLHSQHSNDSTANSTNSGSVYVPACSQTTRPQSLVNLTASQHSQASLSGAPPPPTNYSAVCPLRTNSTESNTSHTSCNSDGRVSNVTTPATSLPFSGPPTSPMVDLAGVYTSSQTSLQYDSSGPGHGLPLNRSAYAAVGCSQEDVQRPCQCTQQPAIGQISMSQGNTNSSAVGHTSTSSSTASTPHQQYGSTMGYTGSANSTSSSSTPQQQYPGNPLLFGAPPGMISHNGPGVIRYNSQHSNESTGSGSSSIPDNSISAHTFHSQPTRRQSLTYSSAPFVHNQTTSQPPTLNHMDSNTPQNSAAGVWTPNDDSTPSFFPSPNQGSICPPSHVPLSAPQNATNT